MVIKLDMSKAYNRVGWGYLKAVMENLGFAPKWVSMIMSCVTSVSYSFLINQEPMGYIILSRGLHQGDPISPYLFLLCAEGLTTLLKNAKHRKHITGVIEGWGGPKLTHLFFADDSILFCRVETEECQNIMSLLGTYEEASG